MNQKSEVSDQKSEFRNQQSAANFCRDKRIPTSESRRLTSGF
jgi:hypothetical protein